MNRLKSLPLLGLLGETVTEEITGGELALVWTPPSCCPLQERTTPRRKRGKKGYERMGIFVFFASID
jgi:hypothetical protein